MAFHAQTLPNRPAHAAGNAPSPALLRLGRLGQLRAVILIAIASACAACSNKALYENIQQNQLRACENLPVPQQAHCKSQYDTTYEDYRRGLEDVADDVQSPITSR